MSTIEDFENAPTGAIATRADGSRAMKIYDGVQSWVTQNRVYLDNESIAKLGFTLNPSMPTTAREALELAWELAHEVKEGQTIPKGAHYLEYYSSGLEEYTAGCDFKITPALAPLVRTVEPLPDPEPDWLDAPAVIATMDGGSYQEVWLPMAGGHWKCTCCHQVRHWPDLVDVTPLYPKEEDGEWVSL